MLFVSSFIPNWRPIDQRYCTKIENNTLINEINIQKGTISTFQSKIDNLEKENKDLKKINQNFFDLLIKTLNNGLNDIITKNINPLEEKIISLGSRILVLEKYHQTISPFLVDISSFSTFKSRLDIVEEKTDNQEKLNKTVFNLLNNISELLTEKQKNKISLTNFDLD